MRKAIKNYADPTAAATASDGVTYTVNKDSIKDAASSYVLKQLTAEQLKNLTAVVEAESTKKNSGKSKKAIYIALVLVAVVAAIFIIRKK